MSMLIGCSNRENRDLPSDLDSSAVSEEESISPEPLVSKTTKGTEYWPGQSFIGLVDSLTSESKIWEVIGSYPVEGIEFVSCHNQGELVNFAVVTDSHDSKSLVWVDINDGQIVNAKFTGAGSDGYFEYYFSTMSQGSFIIAYCTDSNGRGGLYFIPLDNLGMVKYSFDKVYDNNMTFWGIIGAEFGLKDKDGYDVPAADRYVGDKLDFTCEDVNSDGNTDVIFTGIRQIYVGTEMEPQLWREYYVKQVYLYDPAQDDFVLSDELSESILINEY